MSKKRESNVLKKPLNFPLHQGFLQPSSSKVFDKQKLHILQASQSSQEVDFQPTKKLRRCKTITIPEFSEHLNTIQNNDFKILCPSIFAKC